MKLWKMLMMVLAIMLASCQKKMDDAPNGKEYSLEEHRDPALRFMVPLPQGYEWEVTQSWREHCQTCDDKYPPVGGEEAYCDPDGSHMKSCCDHGWDFNLAGNGDMGKPVLASGSGYIRKIGKDAGWGNYIVIDHGGDLCTRYGHMQDGSISHLHRDQYACQGLQLGKIGNTGFSSGEHLHFQFEKCKSGETVARGFDDGNGIPICTKGRDIKDAQGKYNFLVLKNKLRTSCEDAPVVFSGGALPDPGWIYGGCGTLNGCPLFPNCGRSASSHRFTDDGLLSGASKTAANYLWQECVIDGKPDGGFHPNENLARAEALKIAMNLFGLMEDCGVEVDASDVSAGDWFAPYFACGIAKGVISPANLLHPGSDVNFAEAAKMLVVAGIQAGVIYIRQSGQGGAEHAISQSHWGYNYAETMAAYGGLKGLPGNYTADHVLSRREFAVMAASMSPCFCDNVLCRYECNCNQQTFSCSDPGNTSPGTGGGASEGDNRAGAPTENGPSEGDGAREEPEDNQTVEPEFPNVRVHCWVEPLESVCQGTALESLVRCSLQNFEDRLVRAQKLIVQLDDSADGSACRIVKHESSSGVGYQSVNPGETVQISGNFKILCDRPALDGVLELNIDLTERSGGRSFNWQGVSHVRMLLPGSVFVPCAPRCVPQSCNGRVCGSWPDACGGQIQCGACSQGSSCNGQGQCLQNGWSCDPNVGYTIRLNSLGGSLELANSGPIPYLQESFNNGMTKRLNFDCIDLPATILVHGGSNGLSAWVSDAGLPDFAAWLPYNGPLVIEPVAGPTWIGRDIQAQSPNTQMLIRIPVP